VPLVVQSRSSKLVPPRLVHIHGLPGFGGVGRLMDRSLLAYLGRWYAAEGRCQRLRRARGRPVG
jgi:proteasome assembly chaperone (PAC2) family protein